MGGLRVQTPYHPMRTHRLIVACMVGAVEAEVMRADDHATLNHIIGRLKQLVNRESKPLETLRCSARPQTLPSYAWGPIKAVAAQYRMGFS